MSGRIKYDPVVVSTTFVDSYILPTFVWILKIVSIEKNPTDDLILQLRFDYVIRTCSIFTTDIVNCSTIRSQTRLLWHTGALARARLNGEKKKKKRSEKNVNVMITWFDTRDSTFFSSHLIPTFMLSKLKHFLIFLKSSGDAGAPPVTPQAKVIGGGWNRCWASNRLICRK